MNMQMHSIRVLLIDDDEDDCMVVRDLLSGLSSMEFILKCIPDYGAALDAILSSEFDVCLLDYRLGKRNGLELMQEAESLGAMTPIVFLTGQGSSDLDIEAMRKGAADWLTKDELSATLLERSIRHAVERQRKKQELIKANLDLERMVEQRRQAEEALRVSLRFLEIVHAHTEITPLLKEYASEIKSYTGCDAVGIRVLDENWNIPYVVYEGFSREFYESESPLSLKSDECMCINVIRGNVDSSLPFYTEGGAFCINAASRFLATVSEEEKGRTRNRCNQEGYETVALFPFHSEGKIFGLIHVADHRENMVPPSMAKTLERAALQLGTAFQKAHAERKLRESEEHYRSLFDHMLNGFAYCRMHFDGNRPVDFTYLNVNSAFGTLTGLKDVVGKKVSEVIPGMKESNPELLEVYGRVALTGSPERFETFVESLGMWFSISVYSPQKEYFAVVFDVITGRKRAEEEIGRLNRLYEVLSQVNHCVARVRTREEFLPEVCRLIVERGAVDMTWIGLLDPDTSRIDPVAHFGNGDEMLSRVAYYADDRPEGQGNQGKAVRSGQPSFCNRCGSDVCLYPSDQAPGRFGFQSCGSFPLRFQGRICGVLNVCVLEGGFFGKREIELLEEVAMDVSFALDKIEAEIQRKRLSEQFQQQSAFLGALMDAMPYPVFYKDELLRYLGCNRALEQLLGGKREQIIGKTARECWPRGFADLVCRSDLELMANPDRKTVIFEATLRGFDDVQHDFLFHKAVFYNSDGSIGGIIGAMVDITERNRAEESLRESEAKFRSYIEHAPLAVFVADREGRLQDFNPAAADLLGHSPSTLAGMNILEMHPLEDRELAVQDFAALLEKGSVETEHRIKRPDGSLVWVLLHAVMITDRLSLAYCLEITERKRAEEALFESHRELQEAALRLEQSRNMLQLVVESIPVRVFWKDRDLRYLGCNTLFARDAGLSRPEQLLGLDDFALGWREQAEIYRADDRKVMESGLPKLNIIERQSTPAGALIWLNTNKVPLFKPNGEVFGILGVYEDVTRRKQTEEERVRVEAQLRQAQKMESLGTLAGGIAHDFNNILGIITGFTEIAKWELGQGSKVLSKLEEVLKAADRAKELVKQILAFSRRSEQQKLPLQLGVIVKEAMRILRPSLPSTIEIETDVLGNAFVLADPNQMHQVLMNLCANAAHSMQDRGGVLEVRLTDVLLEGESILSRDGLKPGLYAELTVKDTGYGIDPAILNSIFDPFFTTKALGEGTGLGLSMVHGIVESHGGKIDVESEPGKGTSFTVLIPALDSEFAPEKAEARTPLPSGRERVLVVDDEPRLAEVVKKMLESLGYDAVSLTSGAEALEVLSRQPPEKRFQLVITDMTMPHFTGADLAMGLREFEPAIPVILMTGFSRNMDAQKAESLGVQDFLMKPVTLKQLAKTVRQVLDLKQP